MFLFCILDTKITVTVTILIFIKTFFQDKLQNPPVHFLYSAVKNVSIHQIFVVFFVFYMLYYICIIIWRYVYVPSCNRKIYINGKRVNCRKPLIIEGARQVGKTWLMKEFGRKAYADTVYINFDSNSRMAELFSSDLNTDRLIMGIEIYAGKKIDSNNTLLIFDEVQEVPRALSSLKYFYENAPQYHIVCAGSLLGIALHGGTSFPVGKVDFLSLYPSVIQRIFDCDNRRTFC